MCLTTLRHYTSRTGANNDGSEVNISGQGPNMSDWLHNLPVLWMALVVFGVTYLIAAEINAGVNALAVGESARAFKAVSPGILSPMGIVFGLYLAFTAGVTSTVRMRQSVQAICLFLAIAMMHNDNRSSSVLALGLFATGVATHNRPFTGEISVGPGPLLQVLSEEKTS
jgi:hypothetical protein